MENTENNASSHQRGSTDPPLLRTGGGGYNHKFLNKKPWHPKNKRNLTRVWEAEQAHHAAGKRKEKEKQEFLAEQEYLKTISMLSPEEQEKYRQRQSVSWLYQKPPGLPAAENNDGDGDGHAAKQKRRVKEEEGTAAANNKNTKTKDTFGRNGGNNGNAGVTATTMTTKEEEEKKRRFVATVVDGVRAVVAQHQQEYARFDVKKVYAGGLSPPRGGGDPQAENQQLVVAEFDSEEEEKAYKLAKMTEEERRLLERRQRRKRKKEKVEEAKRVLKMAGISVDVLDSRGGGSGSEGELKSSKRTRRRRQSPAPLPPPKNEEKD